MRPLPLIPFAMAIACLAQTPPFEAASVKPAAPRTPAPGDGGGRRGGGSGGCPPRGTFAMDRARVDIGCANLKVLIGFAFQVPPNRVVGPDWLAGDKFDVAATLPEGSSPSHVPEMLQTLLQDRFQLAAHRGTRDEEVNALAVAKGGLKLKEAAPAEDTSATAGGGQIVHLGGLETWRSPRDDGYTLTNPRLGTVVITQGAEHTYRWQAPAITLRGLADLLDNGIAFVPEVVDMTGIEGRYQLDLRVSLAEAFQVAAASPADLQDAVTRAFNHELQKFGLELERRKGTVETIVVDHAEKTPGGN